MRKKIGELEYIIGSETITVPLWFEMRGMHRGYINQEYSIKLNVKDKSIMNTIENQFRKVKKSYYPSIYTTINDYLYWNVYYKIAFVCSELKEINECYEILKNMPLIGIKFNFTKTPDDIRDWIILERL